MKTENAEIAEVCEEFRNSILRGFMQVRHGLMGGRVKCYTRHVIAQKDQEILYLDVNSLYPFCQSVNSYAVGRFETRFGRFLPDLVDFE